MESVIKNAKITIIATYSIVSPPFSEVLKQPPPFLYEDIISYIFTKINIFLLTKKGAVKK